MSVSGLEWVRNHAHRMDAELRRALVALHRPSGFFPCAAARAFTWWAYRRRRLPVLLFPGSRERDRGLESARTRLEQAGCRRCRPLPSIGALATEVTPETLRTLLEQEVVARAAYDREIRALLDVAAPTIGVPAAWEQGLTGRGITIGVLDTGIYPHPDLEGRIVAFQDFVGGRGAPYDDNGHGTHVAGILAASGVTSSGRYRGIAPEAGLVGIKVLDRRGAGRLSQLVAGIEWAVSQAGRLGIRILNASLGAPAYEPCDDDVLCQAAGWAWSRGVVVIAAAGNEGPSPDTISTPGINPSIITVGADDDRETPDPADDRIPPYSGRGPTPDGVSKPDLVAPGTGIVSLRVPGSFIDRTDPASRVDPWHTRLSGTSMACPMVAGACALVLQAEPGLTPGEVKRRLVQSARPVDRAPRTAQGAGLVRVDRALGPSPAPAVSASRSGAAA
ncbi:S8 family peptidase [Carboxydochorda subterranea]|uniref:S8 family peptidase n=1 Tax=Carboxydichorda subterranea TaxID=3109565 RepID=A0ABZ1BZI8_9FIRM|nr:S8 family peptidase [Limnochorda sp. L945t]WRP17911.1 S8 family peptidase [Limnochorda sp. L945t]